MKLGVRIDTHDYNVKMKKGLAFLGQGHKLKITIRLRGRENQHPKLAFDLAQRFIADVSSMGINENNPKLEGRQVTVIIGPEGGFSLDEVAEAQSRGAIPVTLGPRILRTETAGLVVAAALLYHFDDLG